MIKVDIYPFSSLPRCLGIFHDSVMLVVPFKELVSDNVNSNHTQDSWNFSFTFEHREEKYSLPDLCHPSSNHCEETKSQITCFQYPPLYDSSDHEYAFLSHNEISDHGYHDIFTTSSGNESIFM